MNYRYELTILAPTYNEVSNVPTLLAQLRDALKGVDFELLIMDDNSPDGTYARVHEMAREHGNVRVVRRRLRRGLSAACIDGAQAAMGEHIIVMDADLQHDVSIIPAMLARLRGGVDIVVGSRFAQGGSAGGLDGGFRKALSHYGTRFTALILGRKIDDALTGYFGLKTEYFHSLLPKLSDSGFKILFDILFHARSARVEEIGFEFKERVAGESKLGAHIIWQFLTYLGEKMTFGLLPARFISFAVVGASGILVHFLAFYLFRWLASPGDASIWPEQLFGTMVALTSNYLLNNVLTFNDAKLKNRDLLVGLLIFTLISAPGILANVSLAEYVSQNVAGATFLAALAGIAIDTVWKYAVARRWVWKK